MSNPFLESEESNDETPTHVPITQIKPSGDEFSADFLAEQLLKKQYILTALELHTETQERGKEISRLRNYFSNPSNFEQQINCKDTSGSEVLYRTGSCSTFDSLDLTRYSDDGQLVDERVAVLEFELRKARDTIKSLRANLTVSAEQSSCVKNADQDTADNGDGGSANAAREEKEIKPLEIRAINHLVNEYLLDRDYKLSSITFADENEEQDFEDWDDVGINTAKPPGLLTLYRDYSHHMMPKAQLRTVSVMTDDVPIDSSAETAEHEQLVGKLEDDIGKLEQENQLLQQRVEQLHREAENAVGIISNLRDAQTQANVSEECAAPPRLDLDTSATGSSELSPPSPPTEQPGDGNSVTMSDVSFSPPTDRMSSAFWNALLSATQSTVEDSWLKTEVLNVCRTPDELVQLLARCLPHVVPTVLLAKRDQLVPLLLSASALNDDARSRNELLNLLFNLIKKPGDSERQMILHGCVAYAQHIGHLRTEEELLPQCWEQIGHKYPERRQLVAQACGAISPYLRPEMRGSLIVSILQQIDQEERVEPVRCSVVRSLAIVNAFLEDEDKYKQAFQMLRVFLRDRSPAVRAAATETLLPVLAHWALSHGNLHSHMLDALLVDLEDAVKQQNTEGVQSRDAAAASLNQFLPVSHLITYLFVAVLIEVDEGSSTDDTLPAVLLETDDHHLPTFQNQLNDPRVIFGDEQKFSRCLANFRTELESSSSAKRFEILTWTVDHFSSRLMALCKIADCSVENWVRPLCDLVTTFHDVFGKSFFEKAVTKRFVSFLDECAENLSTAVLPVYVTAIMTSPDKSASKDYVTNFLLQSIISLALSNLPLTSMITTLTFLRSTTQNHDVIVQVLWSCVMHDSASVRAAAASLLIVMTTSDVDGMLLSSRVLPALITLSTDESADVRIATIPSFAAVVENPSVTAESVDRVVVQLVDVLSASAPECDEPSHDGTLLGRHSVRLLVVKTTCKIAATAHPKFVDEFLLPHLVVIAASNNQQRDTAKRSEMALALLETYSNLACCFITNYLLQGSFLPSVKCLLTDMEQLHPEHVNDVTTLICETERRIEQGSIVSDGSPRLFPRGSMSDAAFEFGQAMSVGADDARRKFRTTWDHLKAKAPASPTKFPWNK